MTQQASKLDLVLARIDADLDASLARLFDWLRIPSISTDPAYKEHCRSAAEWLCQAHHDRGVYLWVMEANTTARAFYDRLGATNAGTRRKRTPGT